MLVRLSSIEGVAISQGVTYLLTYLLTYLGARDACTALVHRGRRHLPGRAARTDRPHRLGADRSNLHHVDSGLTYLLTYLPTYLPTHLLTYLPTYLLTY